MEPVINEEYAFQQQQKHVDNSDGAEYDDTNETEDDVEKSLPSASVIRARAGPVQDLPNVDASPSKTLVSILNPQEAVSVHESSSLGSVLARGKSAIHSAPVPSKACEAENSDQLIQQTKQGL